MNKTMYISSVIVISILLIILIILHKKTNTVFQSIIVWLMLYIMSYWCCSCIGLSLMISIVLILLLSFVRCNRRVLEKFDDSKKMMMAIKMIAIKMMMTIKIK